MKTLDINEKVPVKYCVDLWVRDEQMKLAISRVSARIKPAATTSDVPAAIVGFGPSLNQTWEKLRDFKVIFSCSGSHKFLVERGVIPTYHVDVDPRAHKVELLGTPHKDVQYLIASACSPKLFDALQGYDVRLWHIFANVEEGRTFQEMFPRGEWCITGGSNAGLRAMTIARFLGYTNQHIFGIDGSFPEGQKHAASHPNQCPENFATNYNGRGYLTTPAFLECAKQTFHELNQMPDVRATFHGEGLVQDMAKDYIPKPDPKGGLIAFIAPETISAEYCELNRRLHRENIAYGVGGGKHADTVKRLAEKLNTTSILDYGCGKGYLAKALPFPIWCFDPAIEQYRETPRPADIVVCSDVLEHIEPDKLDVVLDDIRRCTRKIAYLVIHTGPAAKTLPDGRNTHLIQNGLDWWGKQLQRFFSVPPNGLIYKPPLIYAVVEPPRTKPTNDTPAKAALCLQT